MTYLALLRGINVGGKAKVEMARLKLTFEGLGYSSVKTFINSGNVVFNTTGISTKNLIANIEAAIEKDFGFHVPTIVRDLPTMEEVIKALPDAWQNDAEQRTDVLFLWEDADYDKVLDELPHKPGI